MHLVQRHAICKTSFAPGCWSRCTAKSKPGDRGRHRFQILQPQFEILHDPGETPGDGNEDEQKWQSLEVGRIVPIYEAAGNGQLTTRWFRRVIHGMLENLEPDIPDAIPAAVRGRMSSSIGGARSGRRTGRRSARA